MEFVTIGYSYNCVSLNLNKQHIKYEKQQFELKLSDAAGFSYNSYMPLQDGGGIYGRCWTWEEESE